MIKYNVNLKPLYELVTEVDNYDWHFLNNEEYERVITHITTSDFKSKPTQSQWNECWIEYNEPSYFTKGFSIDGMYVYRYCNRYIKSDKDIGKQFHTSIISTISSSIGTEQNVTEFGCGSGYNLRLLKRIGHSVYGTDFVQSAINNLKDNGINGEIFDMYNPSKLSKNGVYLTVGAMEQLHVHWKEFYKYLLRSSNLKIHVEPFIEYYDRSTQLGELAYQYHINRKYLLGYLTELRKRSLTEIRIPFGTLYDEGFNIVLWQ